MKELKYILHVTRVNDTEVIELVPLSEFEKLVTERAETTGEYVSLMQRYCRLITQPLTNGMFVPCDEEGNVLEELSSIGDFGEPIAITKEELEQYLQAKKRVLFDGWRLLEDNEDTSISIDVLVHSSESTIWSIPNRHDRKYYDGTTVFKTIEQAINADVKLLMKVK